MGTIVENLKLFANRAALFITGKGATLTVVSLAAPVVGGSLIPAVAIAAGVPITAAMSTVMHHHRETVILNNCRNEIAAQYNIDPQDVSHDHLRALAYGKPAIGVEMQPFFREILKKNDHNRIIKIGANIASALGSIAFVLTMGPAITSALSTAAVTAGVAASAPLISAIGLSVAVGALMFCSNNILESTATNLFSEKHRSAYEKMEGLERQKRKGLEITPEQILDVASTVNPQLKQVIEQKHGKDAVFNMLPLDEKQLLMQEFEPILHIAEFAKKLNSGIVKVNELAFFTIGERSGVPETIPQALIKNHAKNGIAEQLSHAKEWLQEHYLPKNSLHSHTAGVGSSQPHYNNSLANAIVEAKSPGATQTFAGDMPHTISFAQRFADSEAQKKSLTYAEKIRASENVQNIYPHSLH